MLFDYATVLVFLIVPCLFAFFVLTLGKIFRPHKPSAEKATTYECGERPIGKSWIRFNIRFYVIALVFLIFGVEIAVLYPVAAVFKEAKLVALIDMLIFVFILLVGLAYVWRKGDLEWEKSVRQHPIDEGGERPAGIED